MSNIEKTYQRFSIDQRIEHLMLLFSFGVLALTGLPQKFPFSPISEVILRILGGIEVVRFIHRFAAFVMMVEALYHVIMTGYKLFVLRLEPSMLPRLKDVLDGFQSFGYNLGILKKKPRMPRYNYVEKAEYWALVWGTIIMGFTGFMLWNPIATARVLPGQIIPAAKAAHGAEAVLAVLAILLWHFYNVHLRKLNWSIFHGKATQHQMEEEHGEELGQIEAGTQRKPAPAPAREKRQLIFFPIAVVVSLVFLFFVFFFVSYEETAITTFSPVSQVTPYSPQTSTAIPSDSPTPISPTLPAETQAANPQPALQLTWQDGISNMFKQTCSACHGASGGLSLTSYQELVKGGKKGAGIVPGDITGGTIIPLLEAGQHMGKFTPEQLQQLRDWVSAGAPEK